MKSLPVVLKLALAQLLRRPLRLALTVAAMIAAGAMVVWVVSGYDGLIARFDDMADDYLGRYDLVVVPRSPQVAALTPELVDELRSDPAVAEAVPISQSYIRLQTVSEDRPRPVYRATAGGGRGRGGRGGRGSMRMERPALVAMQAEEPPYPIVEGRWLAAGENGAEAVISKKAAKDLGIAVGSAVTATRAIDNRGQADPDATPVSLTVVGIVEQIDAQSALSPRGDAPRGAARGPASSALYVLPATAEQVSGQPTQANMLCVRLHEVAPLSEFRSKWTKLLAATKPAAEIVTTQEIESGLENSFSTRSLRAQAYSATGMSLLASLLIIFATLSMGVSERSRQFALLRAIALTRGQIAAIVVCESAVLVAIGWAGGLFAGWLLLKSMQHFQPQLFEQAAMLGWQCVLLTGICAIGGSFVASLVPMLRAMRSSPLEAMQPRAPKRSTIKLAAVAGCVLIVLPLALAFAVSLESDFVYAVCTAIGVVSLAIGVLLLAPLAVVIVERLLSPVLAALLGLDSRLLRGQLSSNLWRTIGAAAALTVGLGLYAATQTWGYSMLGPFVPDGWMPDALVYFPKGVNEADVAAVAETPAIAPNACLPIALEQPKLTDDVTNSWQRSNATRADNVVLCGVDIERAFGGDSPMVDARFSDGSLEGALPRLRAGRACLIADFLQSEGNLKIGDKLRMTPPNAPTTTVEYTIAGVVRQPGIHWLSKMSGMRRRGGLMAGVVFAPFADVRRDFAATSNDFFWVNLAPGKGALDLQTALEPIAVRNGNPPQESWQMSRGMFEGESPRQFATKVTAANDVREFVNFRADETIWALSQFPLVTLLIGSIGVLNAVMASIVSRRWDFGVMRAVGVTRGSLFRLIVAEAILVALVACVLSLVFGLIAGYCGTGLARYVYRHGGFIVPLTVPWGPLLYGFGVAILVCVVSALVPAMVTMRKEPLRLLQAGRASA